jgi:hypothetical protein
MMRERSEATSERLNCIERQLASAERTELPSLTADPQLDLAAGVIAQRRRCTLP